MTVLKLNETSKEKTNKIIKEVFPVINNPVQLELRKYLYYSFNKKYELKINESEKSFLEIQIVDGAKKRNVVQIFTKKMSLIVCSCSLFNDSQLNYCDHVAVFNRILRDNEIKTLNKTWIDLFSSKRLLLPETIEEYVGNKLKIFDPKNQKLIVVGEGDSVKESININHYKNKNFEEEYKERLDALIDLGINSNGLLINTNLYDYQEDIFKKMIAAKKAIMSMQMGAGKTICAIASYESLTKILEKDLKLLIICPKSLKAQWKKEFAVRTNRDSVLLDNQKDIVDYTSSKPNIGIITYQLLAKSVDSIKHIQYDMIICDEMQYVKNKQTLAWKAISKLKTEYMLGLSGTIIENKLDDLYNVMNIINPKFLGPKWKFDSQFQNILTFNEHHIIYGGVKNVDKLKDKLKCSIFSFDNLSLPPLIEHDEMVELTKEEKAIHDDNYEQAKILQSKGMSKPLSPIEKIKLQAFMLKARQSTISRKLFDDYYTGSSAKLDRFIELVDKYCVEENKKIVVFSDFVEVLKIFQEETVKKHNINSVLFTGEQNAKQRVKAVSEFTNNPDCKIIFLSGAGGVGLDGLQQASNIAILLEVGWNPAQTKQRIARISRIGQKNETHVHHLIANDSIEMKMLESVERKNNIKQKVLYE